MNNINIYKYIYLVNIICNYTVKTNINHVLCQKSETQNFNLNTRRSLGYSFLIIRESGTSHFKGVCYDADSVNP